MLSIQALHGPLTYANWPLYFRVDEKYGRWTFAFAVQWETVDELQMSLWNLQNEKC